MRARPPVLTLLTAATALFVGVLVSSPANATPLPAAVAHVATGTSTTTAGTAATPTITQHPTKRVCSAAKHGQMACNAILRTDVIGKSANAMAITPDATPSGYGPSDLLSAYKLPSNGGAGATVAIVDAYNDPNAASDLATYRSQYGLPACTTASGCLRIVNQTGGSSLPSSDSGWAGEESLDLDMVSAVAPQAHIILVEATSPTDANLYAAENWAAANAGYVSNSWGGSEYSGQTSDDSNFNHPGVVITVSSGDDATGSEYPATSQYVTAVGGTSLSTSSNSRGWTESAWNDAGSGCSSYDAKPSWQTVTTNCSRRAEADVSAVADPNTGVAVYQTYGESGWVVYGGTSVAAPLVAAVYADAGTPAAGTYPASYPYSHQSNLFDVTSGSNGSCGSPICTAGTGWDGPTGLGTPNGTAAFTSGGGGGTGGSVSVGNPGNQTGTVGTAASLTLSASGGTAPYTWTASGLPTGLSISSGGVISGTPSASGSFSVTVTATDSTSLTGSASFTWTINPAGGGSCSGNVLGNPGFESGNTVWSASSGVIGEYAGYENPHSGNWDAWMDGYGTTHTDTVQQTVTIPSGCHGTLTFYLHIDTSETTRTYAYDKLTVTVNGTTKATYSNLNHNTGYALVTQCFPGVVLGLYWRRATGRGVFIGMLAGMLTAVTLMSLHLDPVAGLNAGFVALCINFVVTVTASLATSASASAVAPELTRQA